VEPADVDAELGHSAQRKLGHKRRPVGGEEAIEHPAHAVVVYQSDVAGGEPEGIRGELRRPLADRIDRPALDGEVSDQHPQCGGGAQTKACVGARHVAVEQLRHAEAGKEVVDHRQSAEELRSELKRSPPGHWVPSP
jgi:hypothetical protein